MERRRADPSERKIIFFLAILIADGFFLILLFFSAISITGVFVEDYANSLLIA